MPLETFFLIVFISGMLAALYLEHRFIADMKMLARYLIKKWKEKK